MLLFYRGIKKPLEDEMRFLLRIIIRLLCCRALETVIYLFRSRSVEARGLRDRMLLEGGKRLRDTNTNDFA